MIVLYLVLNGIILLFGVTAIIWSDKIHAPAKWYLSLLYVVFIIASTVASFLISRNDSRDAETRQASLIRQISKLERELKEYQKKSDFQPFVNGHAITDFKVIEFPTTMGKRKIFQAGISLPTNYSEESIKLDIRNIGDLPADKLMVGIRFPRGCGLTAGGMWKELPFVTRTAEGLVSDDSMSSFYIDSPRMIDQGAYFSCDLLRFKFSTNRDTEIPLYVEVSSLFAEKKRFNLIIRFASTQ